MLHLPRIMLASPSSGSGKTVIACGLLQAFKRRGINPVSFKCGPDYIDPMFHSKVIGTPSGNLDTFFSKPDVTRYIFAGNARKAGISVLEGVMGIYDGLGGLSLKASSWDLAMVTATPVILVINAQGMSRSVIPLIQGYLNYQNECGGHLIRGVILNRTGKMTYDLLKEEIEKQTGVRLYGFVPPLKDAEFMSRHLGLILPDEIGNLRLRLNELADELERSLDLDGITALADEAEDYDEREILLPENIAKIQNNLQDIMHNKPEVRIAVAEDEAFCFYYRDNIELLKMFGAEIVTFSPLHDLCLPDHINGLILGGGYPELYAEELSENVSMRNGISRAIRSGMPYLAECGGFMYLHDTMEDMEGNKWKMCSIVPGRAYKSIRSPRFGYINLRINHEGLSIQPYLAEGETVKAHEYHYFESTDPGSDCIAEKPLQGRSWKCMHVTKYGMAGFPHLYYWSDPEFASRYILNAAEYRRKNE